MKINSKAKGNRVELELTKVLNNRFGTGFSRSVGSGNRWSQSNHLSAKATEVYAGDIVCPNGFKWVIECKGGYNDIDIMCQKNAEIDAFLAQVTSDANRTQLKPLLCWKRSRKPWLAFVHTPEAPVGLSLVDELEVVSANLQRAARLRQSILQKAFTGQLV